MSSSIVTLKLPTTILQKYTNASSNSPTPEVAKLKIKKAANGKTTIGPATAPNTTPSSPAAVPTTPAAAAAADDTTNAATNGNNNNGKTTGGAAKTGTNPMNANIRALDRTGAPTRRWTKEPVQLKSFSGYEYSLPGWASK